MSAPVHASDFCIRTWPPEARLVALITANFDDSEAVGDVWTIAGYVGYANQWDYFDDLWRAALDRHDVPYSHMKEMNDPNGPFAKWLPHKEHQLEVVAFFKDLVAAIQKSALYMVASTVWISDLDRFNKEAGLALEAYPLVAYACTSLIGAKYKNLPVMAVFDRANQVHSKLVTARSYANSDKHLFPGLCDTIETVPLAKPLTCRDVPAMQAADFVAREIRKQAWKMKGWQLSDRPISNNRYEQYRQFMEWTRQLTGSDPQLRKSLDALLSGDLIKAVTWDHQQLKDANEVRRGIWFSETE